MDLSKMDPALLSHIPAGKPPKGVFSNFIDPPSRDGQTKMVMYVALPIMFVFLVLRLYTRVRITGAFGANDYLAVVSAVWVGGYCGALHYMLDGPLGEHAWDVSIASIGAPFQKSTVASQITYNLAALFTKVSLLILYLRIFRPSYHATYMIWGGVVVISLGYVGLTVASIVLFVPPPGHPEQWAMTKSAAKTTALQTRHSVSGLFGVVSDFYILLIPMHLVVGLYLPLGRKLGVCGIFLTGLSACICSIIGTVFRFRDRLSQDPLWDTTPAYIMGVVELNVGIICSCLPVLLVLLKRIAKSDPYIGVGRYFRTHLSHARTSGLNPDGGQGKSSQMMRVAIPKPMMTGLRSFIGRGSQAQSQQSRQMESYNDLESMNDDYHAQLKAVQTVVSK